MADHQARSINLRLRPSEHRTVLFIGDLVSSYLAVGGAMIAWMGYSWIGLLARGVKPMTAWAIISNNIHVPVWC